MDQYQLICKIGEGAFSDVFKAQSTVNNKFYAVKCMKKIYKNIKIVRKLKQIQALSILMPHEHIVKMIEVFFDEPTGKLALVFELMEENLYQFLVKNPNTSHRRIKTFMYRLLEAIEFIHKKGIFHRDIKPQNILIKGDSIKLADFGSCKGLFSKPPLTQYISTRWYRAPECLMTDGYYDQKMDIWGYGCVLFQMITKEPLFDGVNEMEQIHKIMKVLGTPPSSLLDYFKSHASHMSEDDFKFPQMKGIGFEKLLPDAPRELIDLLKHLLAFDPKKRISASQALRHDYFKDISKKGRVPVINQPTSRMPQTPETNDSKDTKGKSKESRSLQNSTLPPVHHVKLDLNVNVFNSTSSSMKKTNSKFRSPGKKWMKETKYAEQ